MTARSIRRAAERKARKLAAKEARLQAKEPQQQPSEFQPSEVTQPTTTSQARPPANRQNAQSSTGPRTAAGKAVSSMNALRTGLTGRTVLLPSDDVAAFNAHIRSYWDEYQPQGLRESELVQSLAETRWRLDRIVSLESAIFAQTAATPAEGEQPLTELDVYLKYEKHLRNLHLQENRLNRRYSQELAELRQLQAERRQAETETALSAQASVKSQAKQSQALSPAATPSGFVFSTCIDDSVAEPAIPLPTAA